MKPAAPATAVHAPAVRSIVFVVVGSGLGTQGASEDAGAAAAAVSCRRPLCDARKCAEKFYPYSRSARFPESTCDGCAPTDGRLHRYKRVFIAGFFEPNCFLSFGTNRALRTLASVPGARGDLFASNHGKVAPDKGARKRIEKTA
jgi:hypothetical protein